MRHQNTNSRFSVGRQQRTSVIRDFARHKLEAKGYLIAALNDHSFCWGRPLGAVRSHFSAAVQLPRTVYLGSYGAQGDYIRRRSSVSAVPTASDLAVPEDCRNYWHRSVFVEWRNYEGSYGREEVPY